MRPAADKGDPQTQITEKMENERSRKFSESIFSENRKQPVLHTGP